MANCTNCSAPLPAEGIICLYCGSRNDIDLNSVNYFTSHETDSERFCPRCAIPLKTVDLQIKGRFYIERCKECFGLFFDPGELDALLEASVTNVFEINRKQLDAINNIKSDERAVVYVKCPVCSKIMNRVNFGVKSGVVIDRCREHGIWLDAGELRKLCEWMKAGGKLLDKERQEQLKIEAGTAAEKMRLSGMTGGTAGACGNPDQFCSDSRKETDLLDIVFRAVRFLAG